MQVWNSAKHGTSNKYTAPPYLFPSNIEEQRTCLPPFQFGYQFQFHHDTMISVKHDTVKQEIFLGHISRDTKSTTPACDRVLPASSGAKPIDDNDHRPPVLPIQDPPTPPNTIRITVRCVKAAIILYCRAVPCMPSRLSETHQRQQERRLPACLPYPANNSLRVRDNITPNSTRTVRRKH